MRKDQVQIGKTYAVKVSGRITYVRIVGESPYGGWNGVNVDTKKSVRIKTAARLRYEWQKMPKEVGPSYFAAKMGGMADAAKQVAKEEKIFEGPLATEVTQ